jgi:Family of unknown function (DUF5681)
MSTSENTGRKQKNRFQEGQSGNPNGRPKGSLNATTLAAQALLEGEAEALTRKAIDLAKGGDITALRLCIDRLVPPRKDRPLSLHLPNIDSARDVPRAISALLAAVAAGELTPSDASEVTKLLDAYARSVEIKELAARVDNLEKMTVRS